MSSTRIPIPPPLAGTSDFAPSRLYNRPLPAEVHTTLRTGVLSHFFPNEPSSFQTLAEEASKSQLCGGLEFPSDYAAGRNWAAGWRRCLNLLTANLRILCLTVPFIANIAAAPLVFRNTGPQVAYVGSKACGGCHDGIYQKYVRTPMGRSITRPSAALLNTVVNVRAESLSRDFRVYPQNGELYQSESEQKDGKTVFETAHRLEYAIGAGVNGISFAVRRGNHLFQAPLSYYTRMRKWDLSPGFLESGEGFNRPIYDACIVCHAGRPRAVPRRDGLYDDPPFAEMAIGCENCHGPGQLHIQERARGSRMLPDTSIVNPARLPLRLAEDICMQCHQAGDARVLLPERDYAGFRPSTPLVRTVAIVGLPNDRRDADLLEHHTSMKSSRCYRATKGELSCLTCHDPHEQPDPAKSLAYFRAKCLRCHSETSCRLGLQSRRKNTPADNCVGCHMPRRDLEKISHSALTNHRIPARPESGIAAPDSASLSDMPGLALMNPQAGEPPLPFVTRLAAYGELMSRAPELQTKYFDLLEQARRSASEDPLVLAALGRKALAEGSDAVNFLAKAEQKGVPGASTYIDLSEALSRVGRADDSVAALERGESVFPYSQPIRKHLILGYIRQKQYPKAKLALDRYVRDFPEDSFMRGLLSQAEHGPQR